MLKKAFCFTEIQAVVYEKLRVAQRFLTMKFILGAQHLSLCGKFFFQSLQGKSYSYVVPGHIYSTALFNDSLNEASLLSI